MTTLRAAWQSPGDIPTEALLRMVEDRYQPRRLPPVLCACSVLLGAGILGGIGVLVWYV